MYLPSYFPGVTPNALAFPKQNSKYALVLNYEFLYQILHGKQKEMLHGWHVTSSFVSKNALPDAGVEILLLRIL